MKHINLIILTVVILAGAAAVIGFKTQSEHDHGDGAGHEGHDHSAAEVCEDGAETDAIDDHEGHDHGDGAGHEGHDHSATEACEDSAETDAIDDHEGHDHGDTDDGHVDESVVQLSAVDAKRFGIEVDSAGTGRFDVHITVPGEIMVNADRLAHIVPRVGGIVQDVKKTLGDIVKKGEVMAVIESRDLADAKTVYLSSVERLELARSTFEREEKLWKGKISSEQDYLDARNVFAEARIEIRSAEQKLRALGFGQAYLDKLPEEPKEMLTSFEITAPFGGTVIQKHITLGELVKDDADAFVVADLDTVWVDLQVHQKDVGLVRKGQEVTISVQHGPATEGVIDYVDPVLNKNTRTALVRVVLDNSSSQLRPGTFITAEVLVDSLGSGLVVDKDIIQDVDNTSCVFVQNGHGFEARPVTVGWSNKSKVEIVSGLKAGEKVVTQNSFRLKAELEKTAGASCVGHSH